MGYSQFLLAKLREKLPADIVAPLHQVVKCRREEGSNAWVGHSQFLLAKLREKLPAASTAAVRQVTVCRREEGATARGAFTIPS